MQTPFAGALDLPLVGAVLCILAPGLHLNSSLPTVNAAAIYDVKVDICPSSSGFAPIESQKRQVLVIHELGDIGAVTTGCPKPGRVDHIPHYS